MAYKLILAVLLLLCISANTDAFRRLSLGSGNLKSNGWFGKKHDFYYSVPKGAFHVSLDYNDRSSSGLNVGNGNGKATVSWTYGSRTAKVHAWVNGKFWGSNHVSWKVWAWFH
jgi:hypothetical protein